MTGRSGEPTQAAATVPGEAEGSRGQETTPGDTTKGFIINVNYFLQFLMLTCFLEGERCLCQVEGSH